MSEFDEAFRAACHREFGRHEVMIVRSVLSADKRLMWQSCGYRQKAHIVGWTPDSVAIVEFDCKRWLAPEGSWKVEL